jgi:hypothetical protein
MPKVKDDGTQIFLGQEIIFYGGCMVFGFSAGAFKPDDFSMDDPVFRVKGTHPGGIPFEVEVRIYDIDLHNASFAETVALDAYFKITGQPVGVSRAAIRAMNWGATDGGNLFTKFDFLSSMKDHFDRILGDNNWDGYMRHRSTLDALMEFFEKREQRLEAQRQIVNEAVEKRAAAIANYNYRTLAQNELNQMTRAAQ